MSIDRRQFIAGSASALGLYSAGMIFGSRSLARGPNLRSEGYLELYPGFSDAIIDRHGNKMTDGYPVPPRPDGMDCFRLASGELALMRNHELFMGKLPSELKSFAYNPQMEGGVTRLVLDGHGNVKSSNHVLIGTAVNCAGGPSPWGWLTCEEMFYREHGFVFACDPEASSIQVPRKIAAYGKFTHEAAAVDPLTRIAYLTEDMHDSCFYRFVPTRFDDPFSGRLQALTAGRELELNDLKPGEAIDVDWVDIDDPLALEEQTREQGRRKGALVFRRGEGMHLAQDAVYFTATAGGPVGRGQVFRYDSKAGRLTLLAHATGTGLSSPDNLTLGPNGNLFLCEDNDGGNDIYVLKPSGELLLFASNTRSDSEFCGVCFSPDGKHMFVNLQEDGLTLRISGRFDEL